MHMLVLSAIRSFSTYDSREMLPPRFATMSESHMDCDLDLNRNRVSFP